jgi:hypothetical protein
MHGCRSFFRTVPSLGLVRVQASLCAPEPTVLVLAFASFSFVLKAGANFVLPFFLATNWNLTGELNTVGDAPESTTLVPGEGRSFCPSFQLFLHTNMRLLNL